MSEGKLAIIFVAGLVSGAVLETLTPATVLEAALIYAATRAVLGLFGRGSHV